jgi:phenylpyruvate tautomerase PptA (4-oxalocrotonate tautomerase family)
LENVIKTYLNYVVRYILKMPLWRIYSDPKTFSAEQREGLAKSITDVYHLGRAALPRFYVNVLFLDVDETKDVFIGGERREGFVRIVVEHIARTLPSADDEQGRAMRKGMMDRIENVSG